MSLFLECPFCHQSVFRLFMGWHMKKHTSLQSDGQMTDHVTTREQERFKGSLHDVPQVYVHSVCGGATGMPEEIIRSYLANPFLYSHKTFCTGCNDYVHMGECTWQETGEQVLTYRRNLMKQHLGDRPLINCTPAFITSAKDARSDQNAPDNSMLRLGVAFDGDQGRLDYSYVSDYKPETDWRKDFPELSVLVDYDESANHLYGKTFDFKNGEIAF